MREQGTLRWMLFAALAGFLGGCAAGSGASFPPVAGTAAAAAVAPAVPGPASPAATGTSPALPVAGTAAAAAVASAEPGPASPAATSPLALAAPAVTATAPATPPPLAPSATALSAAAAPPPPLTPGAAALAATPGPAAGAGAWQTYVDSAAGLAVDYPPGWSAQHTPPGVQFAGPAGEVQGAPISLAPVATGRATPEGYLGSDLPNTRCQTAANLHGVEVRNCLDTIAGSRRAEFITHGRNGAPQVWALAAGRRSNAQVFAAMVASLRPAGQ